jgi:pimeloyl-ACP methyl ester carboxylesterase
LATFCLIHGKWHDSSCWDLLSPPLRARGHDVLTPDLPLEDPRTTHAERIRPALDALAGAAEPVVVVGHSLAAAYAPLVAVERPIAVLVYLCPAPVGPFLGVDPPMRSSRKGFPFPPEDEDGASHWEPDAAIAAMYPRLDPEMARARAATLRPGASPADDYPLPEPPEVPSALVYAVEDEFFEPKWERWIAHNVLHVEPIELSGGHFPMLAAPDAFAELLDGLVPS